MDFLAYKQAFATGIGAKSKPSSHEIFLFGRAQKYIRKIEWIPGIRMIAVVNSLSMYATHKDSDIDLFIITERNRIWITRVLITGIFFLYGVWRHGDDVAGNFCLSFWIEEDALDMRHIAIEDDIYLFYWMYHMKPIFLGGDIWEAFQKSNSEYAFSSECFEYLLSRKPLKKQGHFLSWVFDGVNSLFRRIGEKKSKGTWERKGKPSGVIIQPNMLKFHDHDARQEIRKRLLNR